MAKTMRDAFWDKVFETMQTDGSIFVVTADFGAPALDRIASAFPDRFLSVGISEQNLINVAAGLALEGRRVFAYAIAPFFVRTAEQVRINLSMTSQFRPMNVTLIGVGIGFSYVVSGPSHHALEDLAVLHCFPNLEIITPSDTRAAAAAFDLTKQNGIRYLRFDSQALPELYPDMTAFPEKGYTVLHDGKDAEYAIVSSGAMTHIALKIAEELQHCKVIDLLSLNADISAELKQCHKIFTLEEGVLGRGGVDSQIRSLCPDIPVHGFGFSGSYEFKARRREELHQVSGLSKEQLAEAIRKEMEP